MGAGGVPVESLISRPAKRATVDTPPASLSGGVCPMPAKVDLVAYPQKELRDEWSSWLTQTCANWDNFLTITFRSARMPHHALSTLNGIEKVLRNAGAVRGFLGTELHSSRMLHVHGITAHREAGDDQRYYLWQTLFRRYGRSQVVAIRSTGDVAEYVTKYCTKALTEYTIW